MTNQDIQQDENSRSCISRRKLLINSTALTLLYAAHKSARALGLEKTDPKRRLYVGTYNTPVDGGGGNGKGIYLLEMNSETGELTPGKLAAEARSPSWLSLDPNGRYLYTVNEVSDFEGKSGSVSAYSVDQTNGDLRLLNIVSSGGAGPAHLSVESSGMYVFVANYIGGGIAVLPILPTGALRPAVYVHEDEGFVGNTKASTGPFGSFAFSGHDRPHAHMIQSDPGNRFVLHVDLGQDRIYVHDFDADTGKLTPTASAPFEALPSGDGPRHFVFHQNGKWLYSTQEEASTVVFFLFNAATGSLTPQQTISTLPKGFKGTSFTSEIVLSPDGRFLYIANRLHDTIAVFSVGVDGRLAYVAETPTRGDYSRHLSIDPSGHFLYSCNQRSDNITGFRIDRKTGLPTFTGQFTAIGSPTCIVFAS
jgi:6-phosphogluconolactonase